MNILVITNLYPPYVLGGYEILCGQVVEAFQAKGHVVHVLTSNHGLQPATAEIQTESRINRKLKLFTPFGTPPEKNRFSRKKTGKENFSVTQDYIKKVHPELIFIWSQLRLTLGAARASEQSDVPVVYTFNDEHIAGYLPSPFSIRPKGMVKYLIDHTVFHFNTLQSLHFKHSTCISKVVKSNLVRHGLNPVNMSVIYQGIPIEKFPLKDKIGEMAPTPKLLYIGQLHEYKGVHTILEAINIFCQNNEGRDIEITIAGDGPEDYKNHLKRIAALYQIGVVFAGKVAHQEVSRLYRNHNIFVFPSIWQEPFGLTHLEAMASGTPVVSTAEGGQAEFLVHGKNALVFKKEDGTDLADKIGKLVDSRELRTRLALNARSMVEKYFTIQRYVADLEVFLKSILQR